MSVDAGAITWVRRRGVRRHGLALFVDTDGEEELSLHRVIGDARVLPGVDEEIARKRVRVHEAPAVLHPLQPALHGLPDERLRPTSHHCAQRSLVTR